MGMDELKNKAEDAAGKAKEGFGQATGNESMEAEGKADQGKAQLKEKANEVKDKVAGAFNDLVDGNK